MWLHTSHLLEEGDLSLPFFIKKRRGLPRASSRPVFMSHWPEVFMIPPSCKRGWETELLSALLAERGKETHGPGIHHRCPLQGKQPAGSGPVCH